MIDENLAFRLERDQSWDQLHSLALSWPESPQKRWYLGNFLLFGSQDYVQAIEAYSSLVSSGKCPVEVYLRLGQSLHGADRVNEALACYLRVMVESRGRRDTWFQHAVYAYGRACLELGLYGHWLDVWSKLQRDHDLLPKGAYLSALAHLSLSQWSLGWTLYEERCSWFPASGLQLSIPIWQPGFEADGRSLLISSDMGLGDFIFFLRFVPALRVRFSSVFACVVPALHSIAADSGCFDEVFVEGEPLPQWWCWHLPITSVAAFLGCVCPESAALAGYLQVSAAAQSAASHWLRGRSNGRPLVAINWAGNRSAESPGHTVRGRSLRLAQLEAVKSLKKVDLISVQQGEDEQKRESAVMGWLHPLQHELDSKLGDLLSTAAVLSHCDLLITNDTALAHLGGALGIPTWVMLKRHPSWQWGDQGPSPWYSSVRCFRQRVDFVWDDVLKDVDQALEGLIASQRSP